MKRILTETTYDIPYDRWVELGLTDYDLARPVLAHITRPSGFEKSVFTARPRRGAVSVFIPRKIIGSFLYPTRVNLTVYQEIKDKPVIEAPPAEEKAVLNPVPIKTEKKPGIIERIKTGKIRPVDFKSQAIEDTKKRKERLTQVRSEVNISTALKPTGWDGKRILTGDDCDYSLGVSIIPNLIRIEEQHNKNDNSISTLGGNKLLCEYYDLFSFCGIESIIGLYMAAGHKTTGGGSLEYLKRWWVNELSKIYSPTNFGNIKKTGSGMMNALRPKPLKKRPNPGLSIKNAERIIGELFRNKHNGEPLRMKDLHCDVYQPVFLDDEQTRVFTKDETPEARLVDVVIDAGLDPLYFQSRDIKIGERDGKGVYLRSLGPTRRSFDLPIAQHNKNIQLVSVGAALKYQETEENMKGMNPAQLAFLNKKKNYRLDYLDTEKYMKDHAATVSYLRIEAGHMYGVTANSILKQELIECEKSSERSTSWANGNKTAIEWR